MKCQIVKMSGSMCKSTGDYLLVPDDKSLQESYDDKLFVCLSHAKRYVKSHPGSSLHKLEDVRQTMAAAHNAREERASHEDVPVDADAQADLQLAAREPDAVLPPEDTPPRTILYTTAPEDYDGFGARTEQILGTYGTNGKGRTYRKVSIPEEHVEWYRKRCGSGLHNTHTEDEFQEQTQQGFFRAKFLPDEGYTLPELLPPAPEPTRPPLEPPRTLTTLVSTHLAQKPEEPPTVPRTITLVTHAAPAPSAPISSACAQHKGKAETLRQEKSNLSVQIKALQAQAKALEEQAKREEQAAKKQAQLDADARKRHAEQVKIVTEQPLDRYPDLRQALLGGGTSALEAFNEAVAKGIIMVRKAKGTTTQAPRETTPRTSGRQLTQAEMDDILKRSAAGETAVEIGKVHGLHHVTVNAVITGRIKAKSA